MAFEDQRTTVYKVDPEHPESETLPTLRTEELLLNLGPQHPSTHGVLKVILELEGERLVKSTPVLGFLHRGVEKLAEDGTYHQFIPHTDRLDYVCAMYNNFAYCRAVEKLLDLKVPTAPSICERSLRRSSASSAINFGWAPRRSTSGP
jgi:NADH:ubiquinone oxidoreductase subunit D